MTTDTDFTDLSPGLREDAAAYRRLAARGLLTQAQDKSIRTKLAKAAHKELTGRLWDEAQDWIEEPEDE